MKRARARAATRLVPLVWVACAGAPPSAVTPPPVVVGAPPPEAAGAAPAEDGETILAALCPVGVAERPEGRVVGCMTCGFDDRFEVAAVARTVLRFSSVGVVAVALIVVSGIANTMLVTGWSGNPFTFRLPGTYDSILLAKVVVFLLMVRIAITSASYPCERASRAAQHS